MKRVLLILIICSLCGCSKTGRDPREGGFFGGMAGLGSGDYKQRVEDREARLGELRQTQRELDAEKIQLETQKTSVTARLNEDRAKAKAMQKEISALEKASKELSAKQGKDQKRVAELQKRAAALKAQAAKQTSALDALEGEGLGDTETDLRRKQLESQRDALRKEYDLLMKMQMELSR